MNQVIVHEIINDLINIDPELKNIKSELEKLVQELISNKPKTPFTREFKESLKAQIIVAINEQKIIYEEKSRNRTEMLHSLKFWMIGISSLATCFLVFILFQYLNNIQEPITQTTYIGNIETENTKELKNSEISSLEENTNTTTNQDNKTIRTEDDILILPETEKESLPTKSELTTRSFISTNNSYDKTEETEPIPDTEMAIAGSALLKTATAPSSPTFCETSEQFLTSNNIYENTTKTFTYNNQIYKATISFTNNTININNIGTQDDTQIQTELPNLNLFFDNNNFNISADYLPAIIEETDTLIDYYFSRNNQQEGITAQIDKTTNIIFSIQNICIY